VNSKIKLYQLSTQQPNFEYELESILTTAKSCIIISKHKTENKVLIIDSIHAEYTTKNLEATEEQHMLKTSIIDGREVIVPAGKVYKIIKKPYTITLNNLNQSSVYTHKDN